MTIIYSLLITLAVVYTIGLLIWEAIKGELDG